MRTVLAETVNWAGVGSIGAIVVSALVGWWAYSRGRQNDDHLDLTHRIEINVDLQQKIIENLQGDVVKNESGWTDCRRRVDELEAKLAAKNAEVADLKIRLDHALTEIVMLKKRLK